MIEDRWHIEFGKLNRLSFVAPLENLEDIQNNVEFWVKLGHQTGALGLELFYVLGV